MSSTRSPHARDLRRTTVSTARQDARVTGNRMNATKSSSLSSVQKACRILSELSDPGPHRLSNIVGNTGIDKATAIRLLDMLIEEGFAVRDPNDKCYTADASA